jgi:hypothetical protein
MVLECRNMQVAGCKIMLTYLGCKNKRRKDTNILSVILICATYFDHLQAIILFKDT